MTLAPFSVTATVSNKKEVDPRRPIPIVTGGFGVTTSVAVAENGKGIAGGKYASGLRNPRTPLKYDAKYLVVVRARNWIGRTTEVRSTVRTWTTPKVERFSVKTSAGSTIDGTSTVSAALTPDSTMTVWFSRPMAAGLVGLDSTTTVNHKWRRNRLALRLSGLAQGSKHKLVVKNARDTSGHPLLKPFVLGFDIVTEPSVSFSVTQGQTVAVNREILVTFDKPMLMETVIFDASFSKSSAWNKEATVLTVRPSGQNYQTKYSLKVGPGAKGQDGSSLQGEKLIEWMTSKKPAPSLALKQQSLLARQKYLMDHRKPIVMGPARHYPGMPEGSVSTVPPLIPGYWAP